jgi:manganese transport protein
VATLEEAHALLEPLLGSHLAPLAFAIALLAAGQSSTITGTLAGQIVMEGFIRLRLRPVLRRLLTRSLAIVPAVVVIVWQGEAGVDPLLILSQVILSLQLSFAIVPLVHFTSDRRRMAEFATPRWGQVLAWLAAALIIGLNLKLIHETIVSGYAAFRFAGLDLAWPVINDHPAVRYLLMPATLLLVPLLAWMVFEPFWRGRRRAAWAEMPVPALPAPETTIGRQYRRIAIALEASRHDPQILAGVIPLIRAAGSEVVLIHSVESATARFIGSSVRDTHAVAAAGYLEGVAGRLIQAGVRCSVRVGAGEPEDEVARIAEEEQVDLIVTGSHGHRWLGDLFHGSTTSELRHRTSIPVLTVRAAAPAWPARAPAASSWGSRAPGRC